jgi:hypothetical protein
MEPAQAFLEFGRELRHIRLLTQKWPARTGRARHLYEQELALYAAYDVPRRSNRPCFDILPSYRAAWAGSQRIFITY